MRDTLSEDMERAGRLLSKLKLADECLSREHMARRAWAAAVGKRIAAHATAVSLVRGRLVVDCEDGVWQKQLFYLRHQVLRKLHQFIDPSLVEELEFRIRVPRIKPQSEAVAASAGPLFADEADGIADPVLRQVYIASRQRAEREAKRATA